MTSRRSNGDGFERMKEVSDSDTDHFGDNESGKRKYKVDAHSSSNDSPCCTTLNRRDVICLIIGAVIVGVAIVIFVILGVTLHSGGRSKSKEAYNDVRLPSDLKPELYTIHLTPDLNTLAVFGSVVMNIKTQSNTDRIILHAKDMNVTSATLEINDEVASVRNTYFYTDHDFFVIEVDELKTGDLAKLSLDFNYTLRDDLVGFYLSSYKRSNGETVRLATTQFEPTDARRAFPCFDEPAMKANFSIKITHRQEYTAVSNMPVKSKAKRQSPAEMVTTEFETSYTMSTYLVAFVVSDFQCSDPSTVNSHIEVRICASPVVFNSTDYAQNVTNVVIGYYEEFFGVKYPLPKQDLFAIPDFAAGAMENWGLITYRETALLYDSTQNPLTSKQRVAVVIAHELAHQWFGNLVTMEWWDGLWLNEGFASYVEYIGADHKESDWKMLEQFFVDTIQTAYLADGLNWSHPIIQEVSDPDEINGLFDSISYDKGASLIRMLLNFISKETFEEGLEKYLNAHKFGNAETSDLWKAMDEVAESLPSGVTVPNMMDTWTKQMGYPVVTITRKDSSVSFTQERYLQNPLPSGGEMSPSPYDYKWIIPFTYLVSSNPQKENSAVLKDREGSLKVQISSSDFLKANVKQNGFYRVNYDDANWKAIIKHMTSTSYSQVLSGVDRAGLIDDVFALSSAGLLNITTALDLSLYLQQEREYVPWAAAFKWFNILSDRLSLTPIYGKFQQYVTYLINNTAAAYPLDSSGLSHLETFLRTIILQAAWEFGDMEVAESAKQMFANWMNDEANLIPPNLRMVVYPAGIAFGGEEEWEFLWQRYKNVNDPYEKSLCLYSLSFSREPWILNRYLQLSLTDVRSQDTLYVIRKVSENVHGRYLAWNFFRDNWDTLFLKYGGGSFSFSRLIRTITKAFSTDWQLHEVESFFEEHSDAGSAALAVEQSKETIRGNILWVNENMNVIGNWIKQQKFPN